MKREQISEVWVKIMGTIALYERALELADPEMDKADLFREAIKTFVYLKAGERLIALGGKAPDMQDIPLRREDM